MDWISCKLVSLDEISLNLAARAGFRSIIRVEICPNPKGDPGSPFSFVNGIDR